MVDEYILDIKKYAKDKNVPIMMDDGIKFLTNYIKETKRYNILEIGTAIGYSSILMALQDENIKVTTIEKDEVRYKEALKNIKNLGLDGRINPIFNDALNVTLNDTYDLIFIDAAKSKNEEFFIKFSNNLKDNGVIITDNINFHGLTNKDLSEIKSRDLRGLVRKIKNYKEFLMNNKAYKTTFYDVGDGISISKKR